MLTPDFIRYGLLAAAGLLGLGLLLAAWRRPNRRWRVARLLASVVAVAALWLLAYPPTRLVPARRNEAILLTAGYSPDTLWALRRQLGPAAPVWSYGLPTPPAGSRPLGSLLALAERQPALRQLHVLGQGLPAPDLPALGAVPVRWHSAAYPGIAAAYWPRQLVLGQVFEVEGTVGPVGAGAWLRLRGAGAGRDSVRVPAAGGAFRLRYRPRAAGLLLPTLVLRPATRPPVAEPLPVEVTDEQKPPVLLLAAAPGFEFKFLKNSLAAAGRAVALRTPVSRGLVQTEVVNQPAQALDHLTPALLARYPLAVADAAALAALPPAESQTLRAAVQGGRLGLVVLAGPGALPAAVPGRAAFSVQPGPADAAPTALAWPDAPAKLRAALPASLRPGAGLRPLVLAGPSQRPVVAAHRVGLGAVVVSVVPETFRWMLQGDSTGYRAYWSRLLAAALPPPAPAAAWQLAEAWPRRGYPLTLRLAAGRLPGPAEALRVRPLAGGPVAHLALAQDPRLPEWSTAPYWPGQAGWHEVRGPGAAIYHFFVFDSAAWRGPELAARARSQAARTGEAPASRYLVREPWPAGWLLALFVLAAGFLWLEEKL
ncbi:hypothetical protein HHL22_12440 [Hymenobacter sp. RP-2-7]|uniref:Aerotolerance regulator N-terminal domain-containing protein n=1 Tax=Hymenobacter polaris TaxID=2682546 RepID=A0A7Y0FMM0_9BACT|nr:hypothetical protein [Hymenobacter polaris]NML66013.1 hypothetical protein [Hymenobacter polaris]